jgi:predicted dehydrogenase
VRDQPLSTVLVGLGRIGAGYAADSRMAPYFPYATHAQVLADHPEFALTAVVDPSADARRSFQDSWKASYVVSSLSELPSDFRPDVAVIATPPEHRLAALQGLPTVLAAIVEKPLGPTLPASAALVNWCRQKNVLLQVNLVRRADRTLQELASGGLLARVGGIQAAFGLYGNGLLNNGTHIVDLARMLIGEVEAVSAANGGTPASGGPLRGDTQVPFILRMSNGVTVMVQPLTFAHYRENALDVWGEQGRLALMQEGLAAMWYPRVANRAMSDEHEIASDQPQLLPHTLGHALYRMYDNLAEAIDGRTPIWSSGESALQTARVVEAILESARRNGESVPVASVQQACLG